MPAYNAGIFIEYQTKHFESQTTFVECQTKFVKSQAELVEAYFATGLRYHFFFFFGCSCFGFSSAFGNG